MPIIISMMFQLSPLENCKICPCVLHDFESRVIETRYTGGQDPMTGKVSRIINDGRITDWSDWAEHHLIR